MNIHEACQAICGESLADNIIADMGIHWAVIAAMSDPRAAEQPEACAVIRAWNAEQGQSRSGHSEISSDADKP